MDGMREWLTRAALTWDELVKGWMPMLTTSGVIAHHFKRAKSITKGAALLLALSARPALLPASSPDHGQLAEARGDTPATRLGQQKRGLVRVEAAPRMSPANR